MSNSISISDVLDTLFLIAPQFYTTDQDKLTIYERYAQLISCQVNARLLSCCGVMIYALLLAHYLELQKNSNLGIASNMTEGDLSIGYNVSPDMNALLMTPYGRSYVDLVKRTVVGSTVTNLPPVLGGVYQYVPTCGCGGYGYGYGGCC